MNYYNELLAAAHAFGLTINKLPDDGEIHRSGTLAKPKSLVGWAYVGPNYKYAAFGDWSTGAKQAWVPQGCSFTHQDKLTLKLLSKANKVKRINNQIKAISQCKKIWQQSSSANNHSYIIRKRIKPYTARVDHFDNLLIPVCSLDGDLMSLQFISPEGEKRFKKDASPKGHAAMIGILEGTSTLLVCEGYATGCSLHEATSLPVVVAFNAGNLEAVCTSLKRKHPMLKIILSADNDHRAEQKGQTNVGLDKANAIAKLLNLQMIWPNFSDDDLGSDFNDVHCQLGIDGLRMMLSPVFDGGTK